MSIVSFYVGFKVTLTNFLHSDSGTWNLKLALEGVESGRFGEGGVVCAHWAEAEN